MEAQLTWVEKLHAKKSPDANGIDIREEVKFTLPDQGMFTGGWCRPQNDGAPLRAITLMNYSDILQKMAYPFLGRAEIMDIQSRISTEVQIDLD